MNRQDGTRFRGEPTTSTNELIGVRDNRVAV